MIVKFWYGDGDEEESFLMEIKASKERIMKLLEEYRKTDPEGYNDWEFLEFLKKNGVKARIIEPDEVIYF
jgi:hypothetical protein